MSEEHADCTVHEKKSIKLNPMIENKLSIVFGGAMSNAYENSFFDKMCFVLMYHGFMNASEYFLNTFCIIIRFRLYLIEISIP